MRHKVKGKKLNRNTKQRKALFKNLIEALILKERIKTTEAKAKTVRRLVEKLVTKAKKGNLHQRRQVLSVLPKRAVRKLFDEIALRFKERRSGFTRIVKLGKRRGDNAPMVAMEWVESVKEVADKKKKSQKAQRGTKGTKTRGAKRKSSMSS